MRNKKGEILVENLVFIILNVLFLGILVAFLLQQGSGAVFLEDAYSKQIALLIDSSKPGMSIKIDMEKGFELAEKNNVVFADVVIISGNVVEVKLSSQSGYKYSFFNDAIALDAYPDKENNKYNGLYVLTVVDK